MVRTRTITRSEEYSESIIDTVREPLIVLDQDLRVVSASRSFYEFFKVNPEETVGQLIYNLGNRQWDIPKLRELLETILPQKTTFDNYEVEHDFATIGRRTMLLNARQIQRVLGKERVILLAIDDITERKEIEAKRKTAEETVRETQQFLRLVLDTIPVRIFWKDIDLNYLGCNHVFASDAGLDSPEAIIGRSDFDMVWKEQANLYRTDDQAVISSNTPRLNYEEPQTTPQGDLIWLRTSKIPLLDAKGKIKGVLGTYEDITESKMYRDHLETLIVERTTHLTKRLKELKCLYAVSSLVAESCESIDQTLEAAVCLIPSGWLYPEITGAKIVFEGREFASANFRDTAWKQSADIVISGENIGTVEVCYLKEGPALDEGPFLKEEREQILDIAKQLGVMIGRKQAEEKLVRLNQQHELILCSVAEGILGLDLQGNHMFVNPAAARMLGYKAKELLGCPSHSTWHHTKPDGSPYLEEECAIHASYREGSAYGVTTDVFWRKDGTSFPVEYVSKPIYEQDRLVGTVLTFADITERKRAEEELLSTLKQLQESQDMLIRSEKLAAIGQLSAGVAHEILNPVNIMGMKLQMLEMTEVLSEKTKEAIRTCENQIKRITKITRDLQQFARVSEKQITPSNINELIDQVFSLMGPRIKTEDVKVDARYQPDLPLVPLDRDRMGQVILNLINNALDAMKGRPERVLRVTTELTDKNVVRLSFSDTGTGIPPEILIRIFDPFFTTKEEGKGTGLGLSISYGIIQDHGGTILAENNAEGGASFFIDLPVEGTDGGK